MQKRVSFVALALMCIPHVVVRAQNTAEAGRLQIDSLFDVFQGYYSNMSLDTAWDVLQSIRDIAARDFSAESAEYARARHNEALILAAKGRHAEAEQIYGEALHIRQKALGPDHPDCAKTLNNLANLYLTTGDLERAEPLLIRARDIWSLNPGKDSPYYAAALLNLAVLYYELGNFPKAEALYIETKDLDARTVGADHPFYAESLNNLANLYWRTQQYHKAEPLYAEASAIRLAAYGKMHPQYAEALFNMANLYKATKRKSLAEEGYRQAADIWRQTQGETHPDFALAVNSLALLMSETGRLAPADSLFRVALGIRRSALGSEHPLYALTLAQLAEVCRLRGQHAEALALFEESSQCYRAIFMRSLRHLSERELTWYLEALNNLSDLVLLYATSAETPGLGALCMDHALFYKGFALDAATQIRRLAHYDPALRSRFEQLQHISKQLAEEYANPPSERNLSLIASLEDQSEMLEKEMARLRSAYGAIPTPANWRDLRAALRPGEAAVEFVRFRAGNPDDDPERARYAAILLRADSPEPVVIPLCEEALLDSLLRNPGKPKPQYIQSLYTGPSAAQLYRLVWQPLEKTLEDATDLWIAPGGLLHQINLSALQAPGKKRLGLRYRIRQVGTTKGLCARLSPGTDRPDGGRALVCGGLWYDAFPVQEATTHAATRNPGWRYLRWTDIEAQSVQDMLNDAGFEATLWREGEGTEERLKQFVAGGDTRILHLATHGFFFAKPSADNPAEGAGPFAQITHPMLRSGLLLAGVNSFWNSGKLADPEAEDGVLTALEISRLNLTAARLVVLSACETGLGDVHGDEGVFGLQRAFKIAGAQCLILSLWSMSDFHTQELMGLFYSLWLDEGRPIPDAFREAQHAISLKYPDPYLWAGFTLLE